MHQSGVRVIAHDQHTICTLVTEIDDLHAENAALRAELAATQAERDTARADVSHYRTYYSRTGW